MQIVEKVGLLYLGKVYDPAARKTTDEPLFFDSKNLTTHAVCLGMTGSGKTGLGMVLLEEAALDKIPSIIIDPKGDLGNLLLLFPELTPEEFKPWVDPGESARTGEKPSDYAKKVAEKWKKGLQEWGEGPERIKKLKEQVDLAIYTPASQAGISLSILSSFAAPPKEQALDEEAMRDRIMTVTSSLLGLIGIEADPIKSREHTLISTIIGQAWRKGNDLDIVKLIQQIQKPPFNKIGALDADTYFPPKERMNLAIGFNNLLASPGFQAWMEGEPLDIQRLLYTTEGKPRVSVISIAHLSDAERMFFVTLLLNQLILWMRKQSGTSSLRALFYMDEIFGYFPPIAMPPSKIPMLTLLKQARAFGLGIVLTTQNPVDLDYKGLSNCGTWFIGKLQTERDKARVLEGLTIASNGEIKSNELDRMMASTGNRIFIMRSIHYQDPVLFQTRWTLSYMRGPLTLPQIESLTDPALKKAQALTGELVDKVKSSALKPKAAVPPSIQEFFRNRGASQPVHYRPVVVGIAKMHFVDSKNKVDEWKEVCLVANAIEEGKKIDWNDSQDVPDLQKQLEKEPYPNSQFEELPAGLMQEKNYAAFKKSLSEWLYQNWSLATFRYPELSLVSKEGESEGDFRIRTAQTLRENRDLTVQKLRDKYEQKIAALKEKVRRAEEKMVQQKQQVGWQKAESFLSMIAAFIGALFGRGITKGTISKAETSIRRVGRTGRESQEAKRAENDYKAAQSQLDDIRTQLDHEIAQVPFIVDPSVLTIDTIKIKPRKSDISVEKVSLVWWAI